MSGGVYRDSGTPVPGSTAKCECKPSGYILVCLFVCLFVCFFVIIKIMPFGWFLYTFCAKLE